MPPILLALQELGAEEVTVTNPVLPEISELFWGAIAFFTLYALVKFVLLPPVQKGINERADRIRSDLDAADVARQQAGSAATEVSDQLAGVRAESAQIIDAARAEAEADRSRIVGEAEAEVAKAKADAEAEIAAARQTAMAGVGSSVAGVAADAASRIMNRQIDAGSAQPVVDRFLNSSN